MRRTPVHILDSCFPDPGLEEYATELLPDCRRLGPFDPGAGIDINSKGVRCARKRPQETQPVEAMPGLPGRLVRAHLKVLPMRDVDGGRANAGSPASMCLFRAECARSRARREAMGPDLGDNPDPSHAVSAVQRGISIVALEG
jgi:hypothetical protein